MIYTSYFANIRRIRDDVVPISISAIKPIWYEGKSYSKLAPTYDMLHDYKRTKDHRRYALRYTIDVLRELNVKDVEQELKDMSGGKDVVLLCYENPGSFCHRQLVREWFQSNGISCEEYTLR